LILSSEAARLPLLLTAIGWRGVFDQIQFHRQLLDLVLQRRDLRIILGDDAGFGFLIVEFAAIELRQAS
jgi:hypothetical protein